MADWYGVELDQPLGRHDGTVQGVRSETQLLALKVLLEDLWPMITNPIQSIPLSRFFDLLNSMIYGLKRSIDLRWLFDLVLNSSLDDLVVSRKLDKCDKISKKITVFFSKFVTFGVNYEDQTKTWSRHILFYAIHPEFWKSFLGGNRDFGILFEHFWTWLQAIISKIGGKYYYITSCHYYKQFWGLQISCPVLSIKI